MKILQYLAINNTLNIILIKFMRIRIKRITWNMDIIIVIISKKNNTS